MKFTDILYIIWRYYIFHLFKKKIGNYRKSDVCNTLRKKTALKTLPIRNLLHK